MIDYRVWFDQGSGTNFVILKEAIIGTTFIAIDLT